MRDEILEQWLKSYRPEELFDAQGTLKPELLRGQRRISDNPHANGGMLLRDLRLPDFRDYALEIPAPDAVDAEAMRVMGKFLRDVMKENLDQRNFRIFGPDETASNRWDAVFEVTPRAW